MSTVRGGEEFANDHSFMLGDFLVFRYEDLNLFVQIFDQTACLKEEAFTTKPSNAVAFDNERAFDAKAKQVSPKRKIGYRVRKINVIDDSEYSLPKIIWKRGRMIRQPKIEPSENPDIMVHTNNIPQENLEVEVADIPPENAQAKVWDVPPENLQVIVDGISWENLQGC
ncbi:hypothetical protein DsansV1_C17g0145761 [Dioscorea sansibarensis]